MNEKEKKNSNNHQSSLVNIQITYVKKKWPGMQKDFMYQLLLFNYKMFLKFVNN